MTTSRFSLRSHLNHNAVTTRVGGDAVNYVFFPQQTAFAYAIYIVMACMLFAIVAAYASMIRKAGFSAWWILLPGTDALLYLILTSLLLFVPTTYVFGDTTLTAPATLDTYKVLAIATFLLGIASIVAFFVFAFSTWPVEQEVLQLRHRAREANGEAILRRAHSQVTPPPTGPLATSFRGISSPAGAAGTTLLAAVPSTPPEPSSFFCSWCGRERQSDAPMLHHCGSRTRPAVFCSTCGEDLDAGIEYCSRCGTSSSTLSPR
jgi:hypothetical protein